MSYEEFQTKVTEIVSKVNEKAKFKTKDGKYIAYCGDITITGNPETNDMMVSWGSRNEFNSPRQYQRKHEAILKSS